MWPNLDETTDLVTFTKEIFNGKLYFVCSESLKITGFDTNRKGKFSITR